MDWLVIAGFVGILAYIIWDIWLKKPKSKTANRQNPAYAKSKEQYFAENYNDDPVEYVPQNPTFPDGEWAYIDNFAIAGTSFNYDNALLFIEEADDIDNTCGLVLTYEPRNKYDKNAIRVEGWINRKENSRQIGFIPKEIARDIATAYGRPKLAAKFTRGYSGRSVTIYISLYQACQ
ncbi:HIRAN domain-containing protein [Cohaesibacter gelatinilyticus]|uniref:HIRAN domain-containing protein n=1 Tax=Cohaesibacter gelatinilyticus TaxID=372072 RepID=A0A285PJ12_9HYPH|nr:HIRAN domain-containing protein [Cohaesibacter gelatinilyticus]SNZ21720.1 HIRAN domain-containing protein [Cohaesibacter gelatinilyticus]